VKDKPWYKQWRHTVCIMIEQVQKWGAEKITLLGVKGEISNHWTMAEWPALLEDLQKGFKENKILGIWDKIEERRVRLDDLEGIIRVDAVPGGNRFVIVVSCPNQHYEEVTKICKLGGTNAITAWGRADDISSLEEIYGPATAKLALDPDVYSQIPSSAPAASPSDRSPFGGALWWAGTVSRGQVESMFSEVPNGTFLIRNASTSGYTLSFRVDEVHHVKVNERGGKYGVCDDNFFATIPEMVEYFRTEDLAFFKRDAHVESKFKLLHDYRTVVPPEKQPRRRTMDGDQYTLVSAGK